MSQNVTQSIRITIDGTRADHIRAICQANGLSLEGYANDLVERGILAESQEDEAQRLGVEEALSRAEVAVHAARTRRNFALGLPSPPNAAEVLAALESVIERLDDASSVVDPGDGERVAYANDILEAKKTVALIEGNITDYENAAYEIAEAAEQRDLEYQKTLDRCRD